MSEELVKILIFGKLAVSKKRSSYLVKKIYTLKESLTVSENDNAIKIFLTILESEYPDFYIHV